MAHSNSMSKRHGASLKNIDCKWNKVHRKDGKYWRLNIKKMTSVTLFANFWPILKFHWWCLFKKDLIYRSFLFELWKHVASQLMTAFSKVSNLIFLFHQKSISVIKSEPCYFITQSDKTHLYLGSNCGIIKWFI